MTELTLPPSDNPRRKQWERFFNGTQESLDYINRMTEACDQIYKNQTELLRKRAQQYMRDHKTNHYD